ncbi:MAG TPA: MFS transporter [Planctomycetota bacterium]
MPALLALAFVAFVSLGLPDGVLGVAWPAVRGSFDVRMGALGALSIGLGAGYVLSSFFAGRLVSRFGVGTVLWASAGCAAAGLALHAGAPVWWLFAAGAPVIGLGSGAVDAALNVYVARTFSARQVNWLHACYSIGATLGPILMAASIQRAGSWRTGYAALGGLLLVLALLFGITRGRWGGASTSPAVEGAGAAFRHPMVRLQMAAFFVYTGLEATLGQWAFTILTELHQVPAPRAAGEVAAYFGAIAIGRILLGFVVEKAGVDRLVRWSSWGAAAGAALFAFGPGEAARAAGLVLAGLALAPIFPCLMSRTPVRLGEERAVHAIGFQVSAATVGAALLPALGGLLGEAWGLRAVALEAAALAALFALLHERLLRA